MAISRTQEEEAAVREEMMAVCAKVFLSEGYDNASMKQLANEANCTTGKFYSNFSGKAELLQMLGQKLIRITREVAESMMQPDDKPMMLYLYMCALTVETCRLNENIQNLYVNGYTDPDISNDIVVAMNEVLEGLLKEYQIEFPKDELYLRGVMSAGIMRSIVIAENAKKGLEFERELKTMVECELGIYNIPKDVSIALGEQLVTRASDIHEAAYNLIIRILQCKF